VLETTSNLLDQILDFGGIGARSLVLFGHGRSLTSSSGMTNTSTNHYHSLRLIGRIHRPMRTFSRTHAGQPKEHSDTEWALVAPCLTLMTEDAPQRDFCLPAVARRDKVNPI
jgi:hypothetical protein